MGKPLPFPERVGFGNPPSGGTLLPNGKRIFMAFLRKMGVFAKVEIVELWAL